VNSDSTGSLLPGAGQEVLNYTVTNNSTGVQNLAHTAVAVASDASGNITQGGKSVAGCSASWFTATDTAPAYGEIQGGKSVSGSVTVTMQNASTSQDSCQGATPDITVNAS
jgi:hypothetical protein